MLAALAFSCTLRPVHVASLLPSQLTHVVNARLDWRSPFSQMKPASQTAAETWLSPVCESEGMLYWLLVVVRIDVVPAGQYLVYGNSWFWPQFVAVADVLRAGQK